MAAARKIGQTLPTRVVPCNDYCPHMPPREADVAAVIHTKMAAGLLPRDRPQRVSVGPGSDKACDGCEQPITKEQRQYEFDPPGWPTIRLHSDCLGVWHVERMKINAAAIHADGDLSSLNTSAVRIASLLRDGFPSGYCVECLAAKLGISIIEVRGAAQLLVARPGFRVCDRVCYTCGRTKDSVVAFVAGRSAE
jgi:hypothetical protein